VAAAVFIPYQQYARLLKWSALFLLLYIATAFAVNIPWHSALKVIVIPHIALSKSLYDGVDRSFWNHDQSLSLFLAGLSGS